MQKKAEIEYTIEIIGEVDLKKMSKEEFDILV